MQENDAKELPQTESNALPVETTVKEESAETLSPAKRPLLTDVIIMTKPKLVVSKLNETDIDVWTNELHTYYTYDPPNVETESKPEIVKV